MSATKIGKGRYAYRGYELIGNHTWRIVKDGIDWFAGGVESKKAAMEHVDELIEHRITSERALMTDKELIAIDGGWAWLEQKNHIHEEVRS
jgi:hypothetical protein